MAWYKVKRSTKMSSVFRAYAARNGLNLQLLRFMLDGDRVRPEDTPDSLEIEDGEQLEVIPLNLGD